MPNAKGFSLPLSMAAGALGYFVCHSLPLSPAARSTITTAIHYIQPTLIFLMLTLTFCRIRPSDMKLRGWQGWLLAFQTAAAALLCMLHQATAGDISRLFLQSAMLCFLCPTATAAAVVTAKLGGNAGTLTAYTMLANLCAATLYPALIPIVNPAGSIGFWLSFRMIVRRVFPLLICPLAAGLLLRRFLPLLPRMLDRHPDIPFHLWVVSLALAIAVTTRIAVHSQLTLAACLATAAGSLIACALQFAAGRAIGRHYDDHISAAQACGQKNTILAIWIGYTFLHPLTALAGGFYSIWHNLYNARQLAQKDKQ